MVNPLYSALTKSKTTEKETYGNGGGEAESAQAPRALGLAVIHTVYKVHGQSTPYARTRALIGIGPAPRARVCPVSFCFAVVGCSYAGQMEATQAGMHPGPSGGAVLLHSR